ncbi:hypothetical protein D9757_005795 [Collybiopsis confluens]|uniref:ELMO domain-containing protein n=1 Tax=Collybiopsis confluens TaxID=2823264 RepID=A0A8H5MBA2_9AGAR|nr:hypothetical protein D9757_005795 [Collybiopsis confluens]
MSNHNSLPPRSPVTSAPASNPNGNQSKSGLVPTNNVTTNEGVTVRARIDPTLTVADVVRQLCVNLKIKGAPSDYALRDENNDLVTNDNLRKKIKAKLDLKLVNAPAKDAKEMKYVRENEFAHEFVNFDGVAQLVDIVFTSQGNILAHALMCISNLMELDYGWASLDDDFILRVVQVLSSLHSPINACRPATAILKKLVEADPTNAPGSQASSSTSGPVLVPGSVYRYGFAIVFEQMRKEPSLLETVVSRLGSADTGMAQNSMMLINSLLTHVSDLRWEEFISKMERLRVRRAVVRLMSQHTVEDLTSGILDFQANMLRVIYRKKSTPVDFETQPSQMADLNSIWNHSKLIEEVDENGQQLKWRKLGFDSEDIVMEFNDVGVLGLECLKRFVERDPDFSKVVLEQLSRPAERRCPIARASNEVVELLSEHWAIFAPGYSTSTTFQPFFLDFFKVHALATSFFLRMWSESGAASGDFVRVVALVRSQVKVALRSENVRAWHEVEHDLLECEYRAVRDRQMKELELEDDLLSKVPVRNLRAKIYKESYEFVRQQRIQCLLQGAWFVIAVPGDSPMSRDSRRPNKPWRFMRLDNGLRYLHYVDSAMKFPVRSGLEDLPERIEIAAIVEIATGQCLLPPNVLHHSDLPPASPLGPSPLSFSLLAAHDEGGIRSLADQIAPDQSRWADWTDGLNMLRKDSGHVASKETAGFVQALTEIGLKIKLLGVSSFIHLSGEMVDIPSGLTAGPPPPNLDFFFSPLI